MELVSISRHGSLHEHAALRPVLPDGRRMFMNLSPRRLLRDPLVGATRCRAFDLRPMNVEHGGQRGDVEDVADAVLRELRGALGVGHSADLPRQVGPLKTEHESVTKMSK